MKRKVAEVAAESTQARKKRRGHSEEREREEEAVAEDLLAEDTIVKTQARRQEAGAMKNEEKQTGVVRVNAGPPSSSMRSVQKKFRQTVVTKESFVSKFKLPNMPKADAYYMPKLVEPSVATKWYEELLKLDTWYRPTLKVYGRPVRQNRSIAAYATSPQLTAKYSNHLVEMHYDYPPVLRKIQDEVEEALGVGFDHCMLNWYQDGSENIGKHRDTKENQVIASLSLGAERTFVFAPTKPIVGTTGTKFILRNGSLLVMQGETQDHWKHEIPKEPKIKEGRISLTFRQLVHDK